MDPLFLALPVLEKARNKTPEHLGRFCSKDQIFGGWAESCDVAMKLSTVSGMNLEVINGCNGALHRCVISCNNDILCGRHRASACISVKGISLLLAGHMLQQSLPLYDVAPRAIEMWSLSALPKKLIHVQISH